MEENIQYIGETLWPGQLGHFLVILSFVSILFSIFSYWQDSKKGFDSNDKSWRKFGRVGFVLHSISVYGIIGILFYVMTQLMYEYNYVFEHCSDDLPMRYIFSAFWEGQEGSFLLWMFWHTVLGLLLIRFAKKWESPVLMFLGIIEAIIASMILGIHIEIGDWVYKVGSNPTLLLRDVFDIPLFQQADYLKSVKGDGLNPLLQNYWMTIHPPTLFLGFASCTIPFAYAAAGFYMKEYKSWLKPGLKWGLFASAILGVGILMGAAWAYEALTFGGYWAWDPVENMSLVPWIVLVAGVHTNLIAKATGRAIKSTFVYYSLGFVLILYSTYLTRSGVLGDTSQHAFTEMGLEPQLIFLVAFSALIPIWLYFTRSKSVPVLKKEESIYSREFWMYVGALVLLFSGVIISASTSLPVLNAIIRIFEPGFKGHVIQDPIPHFNKFQIWVAVLVTVLSAKTIHLRYKAGDWSNSMKVKYAIKNFSHFGIAIVLTYLTSLWIDYFHWKYTLLALCCYFTIVSNISYLISNIKTNSKAISAAISHFGFAAMVIGTLTSGLNESTITNMPFVMRELVKPEDEGKVIDLIKNERFFSKGYWITYIEDTIVDRTRSFKIKFEKEGPNQQIVESFFVKPNVLFSNDLTKVAASNPDTRHYIEKDIFVTVESLPASQINIESAKEVEDSLKYVEYSKKLGDTIFLKDKFGVIEYLNFEPTHEDYEKENNDIGIGLGIRFYADKSEKNPLAEPAVALRENLLYQYPDQINDFGIKVKLNDKTFDNYFTPEDKLNYSKKIIKQGESFELNNAEFKLIGFDKNIDNFNYKEEPNDVAVKAIVEVTHKGITDILNPIFVIRNNRPFSIKDYFPKAGVHLRMSQIDPVNELFTFQMASDIRSDSAIIVDIAENVPRTDFIAISATVFPGINLFWLGSICMMLGLFIAYLQRRKDKYA